MIVQGVFERLWLSIVFCAASVLWVMLPVVNGGESPVIVRNIDARVANWQDAGVTLKPGESASIHPPFLPHPQTGRNTNVWGVIDHTVRQKHDAAGVDGGHVSAGENFVAKGRPEGALLVRDGNGNIYHFASAKPGHYEPLVLRTPGPISFIANDEAPPGGFGPNVGPQPGKGFSDNEGSIQVRITITRP